MSEAKDGGGAFPLYVHKTGWAYEPGMTLRDYFAAKAMHQMLHGAVMPEGYDATEALSMLGARAYEIADAMLKARAP